MALLSFIALTDNAAAGAAPATDPGALGAELKGLVRAAVGAFASPETFHYAPTGLSKTRSGMIMRWILR